MEEKTTTVVEEVKEESKLISKLKKSKKYLKYAGVAAVSVIAGALIGKATSNNNDSSCEYLDDPAASYEIEDSTDGD